MKNTIFLVVIGILMILAGLFCLFNPLAGSVAAETLAGWSFLLLGILQIVVALRASEWKARFWAIILGVLAIVVGISLLSDPLAGILALTVLVGISFTASGIFKLIAGFGLTQANYKWLVLVSGAISVLLGGMILANIPGAAVVTLGILLGVELLSDGMALLALASVARRIDRHD